MGSAHAQAGQQAALQPWPVTMMGWYRGLVVETALVAALLGQATVRLPPVLGMMRPSCMHSTGFKRGGELHAPVARNVASHWAHCREPHAT